MGSDFLAKIKLALIGKEQVVAGLKETEAAARKLSNVKVTTIYNKEGLVTGQRIQETFKVMGESTKKTTQNMGDFEKALRRVAVVAPVWMIFRAVVMGTMQIIQEQIKFLIDLETAMARIKIVGKGTAEEYEKLKIQLVGLGQAYGISASEALEAAKIFAQQGRTVEETFRLTAAAMIGAQVLGTNIKEVINDLTAAIEGFNIPVNDSVSIIDKWINVEKQYAVTSKDLAEATKVAGATASQLGVGMDEFLGHVTAIIEVTRKSGSQAGNALQFVYARLMTNGKKIVEQIARVPYYLDKQGKATNEVTGAYRNTGDILDDLALKWSTLTEKQKLDIATQVASKRQLASFMALMKNYDAALFARVDSYAAAGQAQKAFNILQDTAAVKLKQVSVAWNTLALAIGETDLFKGLITDVKDTILIFADLINHAKTYAIVISQQNDKMQMGLETQKSGLNSLLDLVKLRDKFMAAPPSDKNKEVLERITKAINTLSEEFPYLKVDIDEGNLATISERIDKVKEVIEKKQIEINIKAKYDIKRTEVSAELEAIRKQMILNATQPATVLLNIELSNKEREKAIETESKIKELNTQQKEEIDNQLAIYEAQQITKEEINSLTKATTDKTSELVDKEKERLQIDATLGITKAQGVLTSRQLLQLEKELVINSEYIYNSREKEMELAKLQIAIETERTKEIKEAASSLIAQELDLLKIRGATNSQLIDAEIKLRESIGGERNVANLLQTKLELEKEATMEKEKQNKLSSESIELYKIATKYGLDAAKNIAEYLRGQKEFVALKPQEQVIVKRKFTDIYEQEKAKEYFREKGAGIPIKETEAIKTLRELTPADIAQYLKTIPPRAITNMPINIDIAPIQVSVDLANMVDRILSAIGEKLKDKNSPLRKITDDINSENIEEY